MTTGNFGPVKPLGTGARVALVAPAGAIRRADDLSRALENVTSFGWEPVVGANVRHQLGYLAGADEQRLTDLNDAIRSTEIDAIWCVRGGYGSMRLLTGLDYTAFARNPRPLLGFSDITALHAAVHRECGFVTFHAPTARVRMTEFTRRSFECAVVQQRDSCGVAPAGVTLVAGRARGRLVGGNLALITSLLGTKYAPDFDGAILVLEDIGEAVYRVDRMLRQLLLNGALQRCGALVTGDFKPPYTEVPAGNRELNEVLGEAAQEAGIPCLASIPIGHIADQWTIPLGANAEVDTEARTLRVLSA